jgi:hypothetical protein
MIVKKGYNQSLARNVMFLRRKVKFCVNKRDNLPYLRKKDETFLDEWYFFGKVFIRFLYFKS